MTLSALGAAHFASACAALLFGSIVLLEHKGTSSHRALGGAYVAAMILLNLTALGVYRLTGQFGPFHALALVSLAVVIRGIAAAIRRRPGWLVKHYYFIAWSYIGLLAAACTEVMARTPLFRGVVGGGQRVVLFGLSIAVLFTIVGMILLPRLQARALAHQRVD
jgi:uncharacterized membrane protein